MLANCGRLGLDWAQVSLSGYFECLEATEDGATKPEPSDFLKRLVNGETAGNG